MYVCMYVFMCVYIYISSYVYIYIYTYIYIYAYIYIHIDLFIALMRETSRESQNPSGSSVFVAIAVSFSCMHMGVSEN